MLVVAGAPYRYTTTCLLAVQENDVARLILFNPSQQRVFTFRFVPHKRVPTTVVTAWLYELRGFDIYGNPLPGKQIAHAQRLFASGLLTDSRGGDRLALRGGLWAKLY